MKFDFDTSWLVILLGAVLGLVIGSYLATILVRWPAGGIGSGPARSRCDHCHRSLAWFELVPLLSFAALRGRCRTCGEAIPSQHSAFELACGLAGAACVASAAPALAPMIWLLLALAVLDVRHLWLPDRIVLALAAAALLAPPWQTGLAIADRLIGGLCGYALLRMMAWLYRRSRGIDGLGGGDAKLLGAIGLWSGWTGLPLILLGGCAIGLVDALRHIRAGAPATSLKLPLGTYLALATLTFIILKLFGFELVGQS